MEGYDRCMAKNLRKGNETARRLKLIDASRSRSAALLPQLLSRLDSDETVENKRHVVRALGKIGGPKAEAKLLQLLESERGLILGDVAHALGLLRVKRAAPALERLLQHRTEWVRQNAEFALLRLSVRKS